MAMMIDHEKTEALLDDALDYVTDGLQDRDDISSLFDDAELEEIEILDPKMDKFMSNYGFVRGFRMVLNGAPFNVYISPDLSDQDDSPFERRINEG